MAPHEYFIVVIFNNLYLILLIEITNFEGVYRSLIKLFPVSMLGLVVQLKVFATVKPSLEGSLITPVSIIGVLVKLLAGHADINKPPIEKIRQRETGCCVSQFIV